MSWCSAGLLRMSRHVHIPHHPPLVRILFIFAVYTYNDKKHIKNLIGPKVKYFMFWVEQGMKLFRKQNCEKANVFTTLLWKSQISYVVLGITHRH
jgi:hypothetical protein